MLMLEINVLANGGHRNQTCHGILPDGWAVIPDGMVCENFPFGEVEVEEINGVMTVTKWTPGTPPEPEPEAEPTPAEQREQAYNTEKVIEWDGSKLTVTEAAKLWQYYAAEGSDKANQLQTLIAAAKAEIRAKYPDSEVE